MNQKDLHLKSACEISNLVNSKQILAVDIAKYFLKRAHELNPKLNAFNSITDDLALKQAKEIDERIAKGENLPLAGVPIAVKDNMNVIGTKTTCSSKILENFVSTYESTVTQKLWNAGAFCLGKTNLDEFAMGSSTEYSAFGPTKNPYNLEKVPGGSSGGSACAVSARLAPLALGSDTGGSIRQPASFCGIVGLKPTYGLVSRYGLVAFASSLDQIGPFAMNCEDANLMLSVISGHDSKDSTSLNFKFNNNKLNKQDFKGLKVGVIKELKLDENNAKADLVKNINNSITLFKELGAEVKEISMPIASKHALDCYYIIAPAEASSNLSRYEGARYGHRSLKSDTLANMFAYSRSEGFGKEVKRRIIIGTYALSAGYYDAYYKKAQQVRRLISEEFMKVFEEFDVLLTATSPTTAFSFGAKMNDPLAMYLCDIQTIPINLAGLPAISINCGFDDENLPIGLELIAPPLKDKELLEIANCFEKNCVAGVPKCL